MTEMQSVSGVQLSAELAFLVAATRWPHDEDAVAQIRAAAARVADWSLVALLSEAHDVSCLAVEALTQIETGGPDEALIAPAVEMARENAAEQLLQMRETVMLARAFADAGVSLVVLKGVFSGLDIYGLIGMRQSIDIDLLIDRRDLERAAALLGAMGYVRESPPADATARQVADSLRRQKDWTFWHAERDQLIELHWRLFQNTSLMPEATVALAEMSSMRFGSSIPVLPVAFSRLYLVAHGGEHGWARLKWLADLAAILRKDPGYDLVLLRMADEHKVARLVLPGLMLVSELYGISLSEKLVARFTSDWRCRVLLKIAVQSLMAEHTTAPSGPREQAATRKNLGHYLVSNDPRHMLNELRFDLLDGAQGGSLLSSIATRMANVLHVAAKTLFTVSLRKGPKRK